MDEVLYISLAGIGVKNAEGGEEYESDYIKQYKAALLDINKSKEWKYSGSGAQFTQSYNPASAEAGPCRINGVCARDAKGFFYSASTGDVSGILYKMYEGGTENYLLHSKDERFYALAYSPVTSKLFVSAETGGGPARHIAEFDIKSNSLRLLTGGDSVDDNPSAGYDGRILYDSRGVGRDADMNFVCLSQSSLYCLRGNSIEELLSEENFDLLLPKTDKSGNLYYLRKPHVRQRSGGMGRTLINIITLPFWIIYGLGKVLLWLGDKAKKSSKKQKDQRTAGNNPAVSRPAEKSFDVFGENIDIDAEENKNRKRGDKTAGFAPRRFQLWQLSPDGNKKMLKAGVLDYDVTADGTVYYTNGKYVFKLTAGENNGFDEKPLFKDKLILKLGLKNTENKNAGSCSPFDN